MQIKGTIIIILLLLSLKLFSSEPDSLFLGAKIDCYVDNQQIVFFKDTTNKLSLSDVIGQGRKPDFNHPDNLSILEYDTNIWFKLYLKNITDENRDWILGAPDFTYITLYSIDENGHIDTLKAGTLLPQSMKQIGNGMWELIPIKLDKGESKTIYVKAVSNVALKIQRIFQVKDVNNYLVVSNWTNFQQGIFAGFLLMMLLYNLLLFFMTRRKVYLYYNLYIINILISILGLLQYFRNAIYPENPEITNYLGMVIFLAFIFYYMFIKEFIDSKNNHKKIDKFLKILVITNILFAVCAYSISFYNHFYYALLSILFLGFNMLTLMYLIVHIFIVGNKIARIFAMGTSFLIVGTFISLGSRLLGISQEYILVIFQLSILGEVFIYSVGLSYKFKLQEDEAKIAKDNLIVQLQENELLQTKVTRELEDKVNERTLFITQQKEEIDALYKEVHHRVKNNLAIIIGILEAQVEDESLPEIKTALHSASSRINSMGLIHDLIHSNFSVNSISAKEYILKLTNYIIALGTKSSSMETEIICKSDFFVNIKTAVPFGIIVNELLLNSIKHAKRADGRIVCSIEISKNKNDLFLKYKDNGTSIDENSIQKQQSVGMYLINTMTKQLEGSLSISYVNGFEAEFIFKYLN